MLFLKSGTGCAQKAKGDDENYECCKVLLKTLKPTPSGHGWHGKGPTEMGTQYSPSHNPNKDSCSNKPLERISQGTLSWYWKKHLLNTKWIAPGLGKRQPTQILKEKYRVFPGAQQTHPNCSSATCHQDGEALCDKRWNSSNGKNSLKPFVCWKFLISQLK